MIRKGYRIKSYAPYTDGISHKDLMSMTPIVSETSEERIARQARLEPHPKVIAAQEQFERLRKARAKRNK